MRISAFIILTLLSISLCFGQVSFKAKPSGYNISEMDILEIEFILEGGKGSDFQAPQVKGMKYLGGGQGFSNINGAISQTFTLKYQPQGTGNFEIGEASIKHNGNTYKTKPFQIRVNKTWIPSRIHDNDYIIEPIVDKTTAYINEKIILKYQLWSKVNINMNNGPIPKMDHAWIKDISNPKQDVKNWNGTQYLVIDMYEAVIFPTKSGQLKTPSFEKEIQVQIATNQRDFFGRTVYKKVNKKIQVPSITLNIKPLPSPVPSDFNGLIGEFSLESHVNKEAVTLNEAINYQVQLKGKGNFHTFPGFDVKLPSDLEVFDPKKNNNVSYHSQGASGSIQEEYLLIPRISGEFKIPSISFSYFDLKSQSFKKLSTENAIIQVTDQGQIDANPVTRNKKEVNILDQDIRYLHQKEDGQSFISSSSAKYLIHFFGFVIPVFIVFYSFFLQKRNKNESVLAIRAKKRIDKLIDQNLKEANQNKGKPEVFYHHVYQAIIHFVELYLSLEKGDLSKRNLASKMEDLKIPQELQMQLIEMIDECEMAQYAPSGDITSEKVEQVNKVFQSIKSALS